MPRRRLAPHYALSALARLRWSLRRRKRGTFPSLHSAAALTAPQGGGNAQRRYLVRAINRPLSITTKACALATVVRPLCGLSKTAHWAVFPPLLFGCLRGAPLRTLRARSAAATPPPRSARRSTYCALRLHARVKINALRAPLRSAPRSVRSRSFGSLRGVVTFRSLRCGGAHAPLHPLRSPHAVPPVVADSPLRSSSGGSRLRPFGVSASAQGVTRPPMKKGAPRARGCQPPPRPANLGGVRQCPRA